MGKSVVSVSSSAGTGNAVVTETNLTAAVDEISSVVFGLRTSATFAPMDVLGLLSILGLLGVLIAEIVARCVSFPFEAWRLRSKGVWMPIFDLSVFSGVYWLGHGFVLFRSIFLYTMSDATPMIFLNGVFDQPT